MVPAYATITKIDCPYVIDPRNKLDPYGSHVRQPADRTDHQSRRPGTADAPFTNHAPPQVFPGEKERSPSSGRAVSRPLLLSDQHVHLFEPATGVL